LALLDGIEPVVDRHRNPFDRQVRNPGLRLDLLGNRLAEVDCKPAGIRSVQEGERPCIRSETNDQLAGFADPVERGCGRRHYESNTQRGRDDEG
jgi:hypothetical protein